MRWALVFGIALFACNGGPSTDVADSLAVDSAVVDSLVVEETEGEVEDTIAPFEGTQIRLYYGGEMLLMLEQIKDGEVIYRDSIEDHWWHDDALPPILRRDVNGDGRKDLIVFGLSDARNIRSTLYLNTTKGLKYEPSFGVINLEFGPNNEIRGRLHSGNVGANCKTIYVWQGPKLIPKEAVCISCVPDDEQSCERTEYGWYDYDYTGEIARDIIEVLPTAEAEQKFTQHPWVDEEE